jgi:hypothetical protein
MLNTESQILLTTIPSIITGIAGWVLAKQKFAYDSRKRVKLERTRARKDLSKQLYCFKTILHENIIDLEKWLGMEPSDEDCLGRELTLQEEQTKQKRCREREKLFQSTMEKLNELLAIQKKNYPEKPASQLKEILSFIQWNIKYIEINARYDKYRELAKEIDKLFNEFIQLL